MSEQNNLFLRWFIGQARLFTASITGELQPQKLLVQPLSISTVYLSYDPDLTPTQVVTNNKE